MSSDINNTFNFYKFKNLQEYQNTDTNQFEEILEVKFYNQKGELYSVMVGIFKDKENFNIIKKLSREQIIEQIKATESISTYVDTKKYICQE